MTGGMMKRNFYFWWVSLGLILALLLTSLLVPGLAGSLLLAAQLGTFLVAGIRVADLVLGDVRGPLGFLSALGGLLVAVALVGAWFPGLGYPAGFVTLLHSVGVVLLVVPLALPASVRDVLGGC